MHKSNEVGFIFSYIGNKEIKEKRPINEGTQKYLNHLLAKLNYKYPTLFPHINSSKYMITTAYVSYDVDIHLISNIENLKRLKQEIYNLKTVICFGEKAHLAAKKVINQFNLPIKIIKTKNLHYPASRHLKLLQNKIKNTRTNYQVLEVFNELDEKLKIINS